MKSGMMLCATMVLAAATAAWSADKPLPKPSGQDILSHSAPGDWRPVDPENTLYMELPAGRVVMELAPTFAPIHVTAIKKLVRQHYFDGLNIIRAQDNYVVQWGDKENKRSLGGVSPTAPPEFLRPLDRAAHFRPLQDPDTYASQVGFIDSWPVARDVAKGQEWLTHCYGMLGVGRDVKPDSGSGAELYVVIGHSPRQLDRNVALVGRVLQGMELLSTLPRGTAELGFYADPKQDVPIRSIAIAADLPADKRVPYEVLRSDTPVFTQYLEALRSRTTDWFVEPTHRLEVCNAHVPVRVRP